jgi:hypothetical protein
MNLPKSYYFAASRKEVSLMHRKKIILFVVSVFVCCNARQESKSSILCKHPWSYHEIQYNENITSAEEMGYPVVLFRKDHTYKLVFGPLADSGTWEIKDDTIFSSVSKLSNNQKQDLIILKLTADTFRIKNAIGSDVLILTMVPSDKDISSRYDASAGKQHTDKQNTEPEKFNQ